MKHISLFLLSISIVLPISAMQNQQTTSQLALQYGATGAKALGSGLWTAIAKTCGWTFGLSQMAIGGAAVGAGALGVYSLVVAHNKKIERGNLTDDEIRQTLFILGGTAVAVPIGCMLIFKGMKNVWNT